MEKIIFVAVVILFTVQLFAHIYLKAWEMDEGAKTGWQKVGWHVLITLSFPVYLIHLSLVLVKKKRLSKYFYVAFLVVLMGTLIVMLILADFLITKLPFQLLPILIVYSLWFGVSYAIGAFIQVKKHGSL